MRSVLLFLLFPALAFPQSSAQSSAPHPEDLGTVTGHITCADTQRHARLASVRLIPADMKGSKDAKPSGMNDSYGNMLPAVQTDLTGGYTIPSVHPGQYFLRVDLSGYVTPLFEFRRDQLASPTPDVQQRMQRDLQVLNVAPHSTLTADVTLHRGASLSGTVTFDDGSPAIGLSTRVLRRDAKGEFKESIGSAGYSQVDDHGHYRFNALPAGEYVVEVDLTLSRQETTTMPTPTGGMMAAIMNRFLFSLPVYSGGTVRRKDAATIKLDDGQETSGIDITIAIGQLHEVSGSLLAKDGHTINGGKVALLFADDRSQFASVDVNNDDSTFRFPYVPEGNYILSVEQAKDVGSVQVPQRTRSQPTHAHRPPHPPHLRHPRAAPHRPHRPPITHPHRPRQDHDHRLQPTHDPLTPPFTIEVGALPPGTTPGVPA